jgi:crotonobetainyl-CoA:carnitine CoA-transferase CaiB-like acyl-CoA transferase
VENRDALDEEIDGVFGSLSGEEAIERLEQAQIANARMRNIRDFLDHPQLEARDRWREVGSPAGPLRALIPPVTTDGWESQMKPIPEVGQHNEAILKELGFDSETISSLQQT